MKTQRTKSKSYITTLEIKRLFLSFAQAVFSSIPKYEWAYDPNATKILIVDRAVTDYGSIGTKPVIALQRGGYAFYFHVRGQNGINSTNFQVEAFTNLAGDSPNVQRPDTTNKTDILRGSVTFQIISQNEIQTEEITDLLMYHIVGYQDDLKRGGFVKRITGLSVSEISPVKSTSKEHLLACFVNLSFDAQIKIVKDETFHYVRIFVREEDFDNEIDNNKEPYNEELFESHDFTVTDATTITFKKPITTDEKVIIEYTDAISYQVTTEIMTRTSDTEFTIIDGKILGYYSPFEDIQAIPIPDLT